MANNQSRNFLQSTSATNFPFLRDIFEVYDVLFERNKFSIAFVRNVNIDIENLRKDDSFVVHEQ